MNGTGSFNGIKLPTGAVNGYVLTSDALGNARWAAAGAGSNWQLTGNTGTTAGTNYIGTNDAQDLVFKTNSFEKLRIRNSDSDLMMSGSLRIGRGA